VKVVGVVTHPGTIFIVLIIVFALALTAIVPPYTSILDAYVEGCVKTKDGTVLSNNTFAIAFNYAQSDGNKILTEGFQQYDASRNEICGANLQKTSDDYNNDLESLTTSQAAQQESSQQAALIYKCINFTVFGSPNSFNLSVPNTRYPLVIIDSALDRFNSSDVYHPCMPDAMAGFQLRSAVFNCSAMPPCTYSCSPGRTTIQAASTQAGCETEYMLHSFIARFWITFLVFISLNISRMLFMAAVVRLGWRSLTPRGFEFLSNCTRIGETSKTINAQLVVQLNKAIASYERFAIFLFGMALLVHIPYIVVLSVINQVIQYK